MSSDRSSPTGLIITVLAIVVFGGLIAYAVIHGSGSGKTESDATATFVQPSGTVPAVGVGFNMPLDGDTVSNPIDVQLVVGGLRLQKAGEPVTPGFGHMGVIIDGEPTPEGELFVADATHINLTDASHETKLPPLTPGPHTLTVIFMNAKSFSNGPLLAQTIHIIVAPPSS